MAKNYEDMGMHDRGKYIKKHLTEIMEDIRNLPEKDVLAKWLLGATTFYHLKKKHAPELIGKSTPLKRQIAQKAKEKLTPIPTNGNGLPSFPEFSEEWSSEVQLAWISAFLVLAKLESVPEGAQRG